MKTFNPIYLGKTDELEITGADTVYFEAAKETQPVKVTEPMLLTALEHYKHNLGNAHQGGKDTLGRAIIRLLEEHSIEIMPDMDGVELSDGLDNVITRMDEKEPGHRIYWLLCKGNPREDFIQVGAVRGIPLHVRPEFVD